MQVKLVSFNAKRTAREANPRHWSRREDAIREFFQTEAPDIVGTQEMILPYLREVERLLPEYGWVGEGRGGGVHGEYTAIFYKQTAFRVLDWDTFWLSRAPDKPGSRSWLSVFPRTCTWALLQSRATGNVLCVYNTHLDHISMLARSQGLRLIKRHIAARAANCPDIVLMGDFNAAPYSPPLRALRAQDSALVDCYSVNLTGSGGPGRTYHAFTGREDGHPVDYIFVSATLAVQSISVHRQKYREKHLSDHFPVIMTAQL